MKVKKLELPYVGYDFGRDNKWNYDCLIGQYGNPIIGISLKNIVEQYSADADNYLQFHTVMNQIISTIGDGFIVQKIDFFSKKKYIAQEEKTFLQQKYSNHFNGRNYKTIDSVLLFTERMGKNAKKYTFSEKKYKELRDKCERVFMILNQNDFDAKFLFKKDFEKYLAWGLQMEIKEIPSFNNVKSTNEYLQIGDLMVKTISFVDVEQIDLPQMIEPFTNLGGNGVASDLVIDNFSFINELEDYKMIIFNQVISIPKQAERQRELERKKKRHDGISNADKSNLIVSAEIDELLSDIAVTGQLIVDAHFSLIVSAESSEILNKTESIIESKLFTKGIITSKSAYNQLELWRSALIGNATELKDYDLFTTTSEGALCFFFKESYPVGDESSFYLRFTDRQGVPLKIDTSDLPYQIGRINNRNKFVLGPSGSGKSFLMNNIVEQYLDYNYDVVIVDTGDSYSGTCAYKGGKYIQYTEDNPITMNPFAVSQEEFNIEKTEFLANLIFLIWQGADATMSTAQKSILDNTLLSYYHLYFNKGKKWYVNKTNEELILYLRKYNINEEDLFKSNKERETYYDILGVSYNSSYDEIVKAGRKLLTEFHPDKNRDDDNYDLNYFYKVYEAYDTLRDEERRKIYNETNALILPHQEVVKVDFENGNSSDKLRYEIIKWVKEIENKYEVPELSFNSFYEYCEKFLPTYLKSEKSTKIKESEFNIRTFLFVLRDFYKGGIYERTLNENINSSLFDETFIVFEIDNVKDNPKLFPIVTLIIMDTFIQKMRLRNHQRKALIIEEAWKAIASKLMGGYILYLYKTVRKFWGEAVVVTQELDDIIGNAVVKDSIINNSDTFILLDQTKFKDNFEKIAALLSLNKVEQNKIFTINNLNNKFGRARFKEFYLKRGSKGEVYGNEVSLEQYLTYTTEKPEKRAINYYVNGLNNYDEALELFVQHLKKYKEDMKTIVTLTNLYKRPLDNRVINYYKKFKKKNKGKNILKEFEELCKNENIELYELINNNSYENVS